MVSLNKLTGRATLAPPLDAGLDGAKRRSRATHDGLCGEGRSGHRAS